MRLMMTALAFALAATAAHGQTYPTKPVHVIVPFTPGSATDVVARTVAQALLSRLGQVFVVENRPGAGGTIGANLVAKAAPDGYTLLVNSSGHTVNPLIYPSLPFDTAKDFTGVSLLAEQPNILVVAPLPDVPTTEEGGYPGSAYNFWVGMLAPAGTPPIIVERLNKEVAAALASPEVKDRLAALGADAAPMAAADFDKMIAQELKDNAALVKQAGITVQ
jgi:tripartite-type tricarboxylate transporter receptor subunit TctC